MFKEVDRLFAALGQPEYYGREGGKGSDYSRPYICPELRGMGRGPAAMTNSELPLSMVEACEAHARDRTLMTAEQREAKRLRDRQRLENLEAAPKLAARITSEQIEFIARRIAECQRQARR